MNLVEAAALLSGIDLSAAINERERESLERIASRRGADAWVQELVRAIRAHTLEAGQLAIRNLTTRRSTKIDPRTVSNADLLEPSDCYISNDALVKWCMECGAPVPAQLVKIEQQPRPSADYPEELRVAIEAFHAVYADTSAISGRTPKQALLKWLEHNSKLGKDARDRVAMVANWNRKGGAPKTPGE